MHTVVIACTQEPYKFGVLIQNLEYDLNYYYFVGEGGYINSSTLSSFALKDCNERTLSVTCYFSGNTISACIVVYWQNVSNPYGLVNLVTRKLDRVKNQTIIQTSIKLPRRGYHVAVFAFKSDKNMIEGEPLLTYFAVCEEGKRIIEYFFHYSID